MQVKYDKKEIDRLKLSGIFFQSVLIICLFLMMFDKDFAALIVTVPIIVYFTIKNTQLLLYLYSVKKDEIYLELYNEKLSYNSIYEGKVEIKLENIKNMQLTDESVLVCLKNALISKRESKGLLKYYLENNNGVYKIPILGNKSELTKVYNIVAQAIGDHSVIRNPKEFVNLCGAYIFILAGVLWGFLFQVLRQTILLQGFFELLILVIIMVLGHFINRQTLSSGYVSMGLLIRCIGCSLTVAQYILCACQVEEMIKGTIMISSVSTKSFVVISVIYLLAFLLFIPRNGIGKKLASYCVSQREDVHNEKF